MAGQICDIKSEMADADFNPDTISGVRAYAKNKAPAPGHIILCFFSFSKLLYNSLFNEGSGDACDKGAGAAQCFGDFRTGYRLAAKNLAEDT